ncbi:uncharacterized protein LOC141852390 [Brevipalpus obovatus]|uniref:uncharacterized protein LOC141852390 n=1 Tax=Brevipalpus obovatus TaxID=246614 RepID=UPI003D9E42DA
MTPDWFSPSNILESAGQFFKSVSSLDDVDSDNYSASFTSSSFASLEVESSEFSSPSSLSSTSSPSPASSLSSSSSGVSASASLTSSSSIPSTLSSLPEYTLEQVSEHCTVDDCWIVIFDKVYDVTNFLHIHPGGDYVICEHGGRDATVSFQNTLHTKDAYDLMKKYCIGMLVKEQRLYTTRPEDYSDEYRGS